MRNSTPEQHPNATQDHSNSSWLLRAYSAVLSRVMALWSRVPAFFSAPTAVIPQPTLIQHKSLLLPYDVMGPLGINSFLDPKDVATLIVSKEQYSLFQPDLDGLKLLRFVVRGEQEEADGFLTIHPELLLKSGTITDYSGRTFKNITAYEYAYWAKDTHMCRMLERHMDADTATIMHQRCLDIEKNGLTYEQRGVVIEHSRHFNFGPLVSALQNYINGYDNWLATPNWAAIKAAWMAVGIAQRDVPVHVANEYCRRDRSFHPRPAFNEDTLPRDLKFYHYNTKDKPSWFPLAISASDSLGIDYALSCTDIAAAWGPVGCGNIRATIDLAAVSRLDEVRTIDLMQSRENLTLIGRELGIGRLGK